MLPPCKKGGGGLQLEWPSLRASLLGLFAEVWGSCAEIQGSFGRDTGLGCENIWLFGREIGLFCWHLLAACRRKSAWQSSRLSSAPSFCRWYVFGTATHCSTLQHTATHYSTLRVDTIPRCGHLVSAPSLYRWYVSATHFLVLPHSYVWLDSFTAKRHTHALIRVI